MASYNNSLTASKKGMLARDIKRLQINGIFVADSRRLWQIVADSVGISWATILKPFGRLSPNFYKA
uniref:Uncharacterized protein n=1 Tax=Romanomermis culicivorax TaxID=13658 RepID=A0A915K8I6_ROMCU